METLIINGITVRLTGNYWVSKEGSLVFIGPNVEDPAHYRGFSITVGFKVLKDNPLYNNVIVNIIT